MDKAFVGLEGKTLCLALSGHSVKELFDRFDEFKDKDVVWVGQTEPSFYRHYNYPFTHMISYCHGANGEMLDDSVGVVFRDSKARGNSLQEFIYQCAEGKVGRLFFFGGDGYNELDDVYLLGYPCGISTQQAHRGLINDTYTFNNTFHNHDIGNLEVYNVSINSKYTPVKKITYDECLKLL
jgi:hypothetical protein